MPSVPTQATHDLRDFADFLRKLADEGFQYAVIGGCAVSSYARLMGEKLYSVDLDIYVTPEVLFDLLNWAPRQGFRVVKRPKPRHLPVAFIEAYGKEVNALTQTSALPPPDVVARTARIFTLAEHDGLEVPVADPFDLLSNKLAVNRDKDRPHIEFLRRFVEEEAVTAFTHEAKPRDRLVPARRLVDVLGRRVLPRHLADRLIALADTPVDYRFLMGRVPSEEQAQRLLERVRKREKELWKELEEIRSTRRFEDTPHQEL